MHKEKQDQRRQQIRSAAYKLLARNGYKATSMLAIAKQAKASNETLYAWYGNKQNLFRTLIQENTSEIAIALEQALVSGSDIEKILSRVGPLLLEMVTGEKAVALNRAAAADASETGVLGETLANAGRDTIAPLLQRVFVQAHKDGQLQFNSCDDITEVYISLLIGDTQVRRATGALPPLTNAEITIRSNRATKLLIELYSAKLSKPKGSG